MESYKLEPYAMAADIYTNEKAYGNGGWSLYTGAAGWYYKLLTEDLLGIRKQASSLLIKPNLPPDWGGFTATLYLDNTKIDLTVKRNADKGMLVNGQKADCAVLDQTDKKIEVNI